MNNDTNKALKSCPFCGREELSITKLEFVECSCGCSMLIEKWNTRPNNEKALEATKFLAEYFKDWDSEIVLAKFETIKSALEGR